MKIIATLLGVLSAVGGRSGCANVVRDSPASVRTMRPTLGLCRIPISTEASALPETDVDISSSITFVVLIGFLVRSRRQIRRPLLGVRPFDVPPVPDPVRLHNFGNHFIQSE